MQVPVRSPGLCSEAISEQSDECLHSLLPGKCLANCRYIKFCVFHIYLRRFAVCFHNCFPFVYIIWLLPATFAFATSRRWFQIIFAHKRVLYGAMNDILSNQLNRQSRSSSHRRRNCSSYGTRDPHCHRCSSCPSTNRRGPRTRRDCS